VNGIGLGRPLLNGVEPLGQLRRVAKTHDAILLLARRDRARRRRGSNVQGTSDFALRGDAELTATALRSIHSATSGLRQLVSSIAQHAASKGTVTLTMSHRSFARASSIALANPRASKMLGDSGEDMA